MQCIKRTTHTHTHTEAQATKRGTEKKEKPVFESWSVLFMVNHYDFIFFAIIYRRKQWNKSTDHWLLIMHYAFIIHLTMGIEHIEHEWFRQSPCQRNSTTLYSVHCSLNTEHWTPKEFQSFWFAIVLLKYIFQNQTNILFTNRTGTDWPESKMMNFKEM